ncbi:trimeric intracellular cation channel family protein [Candidatus Bathyarchaeota archaeon]|nr:trimeric intracellular cation channel family protein [Candidatus Bathyarchaeota archaeon]
MNLLYALDLLGTAAFAASGAWAGIRRDMDLFGVLVLGLVTATGGGTLRDILLGDFPPFCIKDQTYLYLSILVALVVFFFNNKIDFLKNPLLYFDAIGLGTFVVIGTGKALKFNVGFLGAVLMGVMTATAGGLLRDVLSNRVPLILCKEVYASACVAGGVLLVVLSQVPIHSSLSALIAATMVIILRLLAIRFNWALPRARD